MNRCVSKVRFYCSLSGSRKSSSRHQEYLSEDTFFSLFFRSAGVHRQRTCKFSVRVILGNPEEKEESPRFDTHANIRGKFCCAFDVRTSSFDGSRIFFGNAAKSPIARGTSLLDYVTYSTVLPVPYHSVLYTTSWFHIILFNTTYCMSCEFIYVAS